MKGMNTRKKSVFYLIVLTLFIASLISRTFAQNPEYPFVVFVPSTGGEIQPGTTFTVNVTIVNLLPPGLFAYEFAVYYNTSILNATAAEVPADHFLRPVQNASNIFIVDPGTINQTEGWVSFAASLMDDEDGKVGNGTLATITFTALTGGNATLLVSGLTMPDNWHGMPNPIFVDPDANLIPEFTVPLSMAAFGILSTAAVALKKRPPWK